MPWGSRHEETKEVLMQPWNFVCSKGRFLNWCFYFMNELLKPLMRPTLITPFNYSDFCISIVIFQIYSYVDFLHSHIAIVFLLCFYWQHCTPIFHIHVCSCMHVYIFNQCLYHEILVHLKNLQKNNIFFPLFLFP